MPVNKMSKVHEAVSPNVKTHWFKHDERSDLEREDKGLTATL